MRDSIPRRPRLRPGVRITRRSTDELQVGLAPERHVVVADTSAHRALLAALGHGQARVRTPATLDVARLLSRLAARDLLVDADQMVDQQAAAGGGGGGDDGVGDGAGSAVEVAFAELGSQAATELTTRRRTTVAVVAPDDADEVHELLDRAGLPVVDGRQAARVGLLVSRGEPRRELVDPWQRADRPHLVVTAVEGRVRLGPFVDPGRTACLRCVDAQLAEGDPRRPLVVEQYAAPAPYPEPVPEDLMAIARCWAVRELATWAAGQRPRTWSATVELDPRMSLPTTTWAAHPACGCHWAGVAVPRGALR